MAFHEKTTSKDVARLMVSLGLLLVAFGSFSYLLVRFGANPMAHKNNISLAQLVGIADYKKAQPTLVKGTVAGAQTKKDSPHFDVQFLLQTMIKKDDPVVEFVRAENVALLRYKKEIYGSQVGYEPRPTELQDADFYPWQQLVSTVKPAGGNDRIYSFYSTADTSSIAFVMQAGTAYDVFIYNVFDRAAALRRVHTFHEQAGQLAVPKIYNLSTDGTYMALSLFTCATCTGDLPTTMVVNTRTGAYKLIGKTAELTWGQGGQYQYKELKEVDCPDATSESKCALDPAYLEFKTGQL